MQEEIIKIILKGNNYMILRNVRCSWASVIEPNTKYEHKWEIVAHLDKEQAATEPQR